MSQLQVTGEAKIRDIQGPVVANSGVITALDGAASQYVRGDGTLADFPTSTGGGSSVSYYLNSSVSQGTIGGVAYRELSKEPIIGAGTDITISANGYVASYITDANDPDVLSVPGGNFNCEFYFSVNNNTGNPTTYAELYKYDGTTFTLLGSSVAVPESLNQGTTIAPYYFAIPVATAALALTDRLAIRIYVSVDGRVVTLHTENSHLCQVVTTFSKGMVSLNNLTDQSQFITTGTSGTDFNIVSTGDTHTFNIPVASATNTGKLSNTDWSTFNNKQNALTNPVTGTGTTNTLPKFTGTSAIGNSNITDTGSLITLGSNSTVIGDLIVSKNDRANGSLLTLTNSFNGIGWISGDVIGTLNFTSIDQSLTEPIRARIQALSSTVGNRPANINLAFTTANENTLTEGFRLTNTSNLLIGTTTDSGFRLDVNGTARVSGQLTANSFVPTSSTIPTNGMYLSGTNTLGFATNGTLDMTLSEAGNLGVGVIPSAWSSAYKAIQIGTRAALSDSGGATILNYNLFNDGANKYLVSGVLSMRYIMSDSGHNWQTAPSGTAGGTITFTQAMTLDANGALGIGTTSLTGYSLVVGKNITGSVAGFGIASNGTIQSDVLTGRYFYSLASTQAATFSAQIFHYQAAQGTFGAGSTVNTQIGFNVTSNLIGATNNFGFYGDIPAAANRWNLYMNGTANNYLAGSLGIGSTSVDSIMLRISRSFTSTLTGGILLDGQISSTGTGQTNYLQTTASTAAAAFTAASIRHINIQQGTFGAGSTVTNQFGVFVGANMIGATSNYGFFGDIPSGTNRWNLYMNGSASNYLNGVLTIGTASPNASAKVQIDSTTQGVLLPRMTAAQRTAIATPAEGLIVVQTDGTQGLYLYIGAAWHAITML